MAGGNLNHPKLGVILDTEPVREKADIEAIKDYLLHKQALREYLLLVLGINSALRVKDLLAIKWGDLLALNEFNRELVRRESKTGKVRRIVANDAILEAVAKYRGSGAEVDPSRYVFMGKRGPIQNTSVTRWVKEWCHAVGLKGRYGGRTLRQTWVYHCIRGGVPIPTLMKMLGHSSQEITLRYACIRDVDSEQIYLNIQL